MKKASDAKLWEALDDATMEAEMDAVLAMSPEERRRELAEAGFDLEKVHARADALGAEPVRLEPVAARRPKRSRVAVVVPIAIALAAGAAVVVKSALAPPPVAAHRPADPPAVRAAALRQEARDACAARSLPACLDKLNEARALDPSGDQAPEVQALRRAAGDPPRAP